MYTSRMGPSRRGEESVGEMLIASAGWADGERICRRVKTSRPSAASEGGRGDSSPRSPDTSASSTSPLIPRR
ncbi:MAG: hypothetical protein SGPRY_010512, partial [Prymnesium sp.]